MRPSNRLSCQWILNLVLLTCLTLQTLAAAAEPDDPGAALEKQAMTLRRQGDYGKALEQARTLVKVRKEHLGENHALVAQALNLLANLLCDIGDFAAGKLLFEQALTIRKTTLGPEHQLVAVTLNDYANLLDLMGDQKSAIPMYETALKIHIKQEGPDSANAATAMCNLAPHVGRAGDLKRALSLTRDCLRIRESKSNSEPIGLARTYIALFHLGQAMKLPEQEVKGYFQKGMAILENALSRGAVSITNPHVMALLKEDNNPKTMRRVLKASEESVRSMLAITSERERLALINDQRIFLDRFLWEFSKYSDTAESYEALLRWKGLVAESLIRQREELWAAQNPKAREVFEQLTATRKDLAKLVYAGAEPDKEREFQKSISILVAKKEEQERALSKITNRENTNAESQASAAEICAALGKDEALIDYYFFNPKGFLPEYLVFVFLGGECQKPIRMEIEEAAAINEGVLLYRKLIEGENKVRQLNRRGGELRERLWDPVAQKLGTRKKIYIVADGVLNALPFAALTDGAGDYLIKRYTFSFLSSAQDLLRLGNKPPVQVKGALVAGGIDYNQSVSASRQAAATRGGLAKLSREAKLFPVPALPGTAEEAKAVAAMLNKQGYKGNLVQLGGKNATETEIKRRLSEMRIAHLATHGFFLSREVLSQLNPALLSGQRGITVKYAAKQTHATSGGIGQADWNPLLFSGLLLSGANVGGAEGEDGILTAEEVLGLDLRGLELLVLSACETGLGEIKGGEGVLGMRRAFAIAGAQNLVISLWKVPDKETNLLMQDFYRRLDTTPSKAEALHAAQLAQIERLKITGEDDPRLWAAFFVSGK